jgi:hypothetical protein
MYGIKIERLYGAEHLSIYANPGFRPLRGTSPWAILASSFQEEKCRNSREKL